MPNNKCCLITMITQIEKMATLIQHPHIVAQAAVRWRSMTPVVLRFLRLVDCAFSTWKVWGGEGAFRKDLYNRMQYEIAPIYHHITMSYGFKNECKWPWCIICSVVPNPINWSQKAELSSRVNVVLRLAAPIDPLQELSYCAFQAFSCRDQLRLWLAADKNCIERISIAYRNVV